MRTQRIAIVALAAMLLLAGCKKQQAITSTGTQMTFTATIGGDEGNKTQLQSDYEVFWSNGDAIKVRGGDGTIGTYTTSTGGSTTATFTGSTTLSGSSYTAAYPETSVSSISDGLVTFSLPQGQTLKAGSFDDNVAPMVAKSSTTSLDFKNVCGGLAIRLWSKSGAVDYIKVTSKDGKCLNGSYVVDYSGDTPSMTAPTTGSDNIVLSGTPVTLSTDENNPTVFYVMLPVNSYSKGFNVVAKYGGAEGTEVLNQNFVSVKSIERNKLYLLASTETINTFPIGSLPGKFSVSSTEQVNFSQGNLQYIGGATPYWKFADKQYEYLGTTTNQGSTSETVDRDLFGWGTSNYPHGATNYQPWKTETTNSYYYAYGDAAKNLNDESGKADWGYNQISNGGNMENKWRTLKKDEWVYVLNTRSKTKGTASQIDGTDARFVPITMTNDKGEDVRGLLLFPDAFEWPAAAGTAPNTSRLNVKPSSSWATEDGAKFTLTQFKALEQAGCVFLPAAGYRINTSVDGAGSLGNYWSSTYNFSVSAYGVYFFSGSFNAANNYSRYYGYSVRLVYVP